MGNVTDQVPDKVAGKQLLYAGEQKQYADDAKTDQTSEKKDLKCGQMAGQFPAANGHGHEREKGARHPQGGYDNVMGLVDRHILTFKPN